MKWLCAFILLAACKDKSSTKVLPVAPASATSTAPVAQARSDASQAASKPANTYVGSDVCVDCHSREHARWSQDWHARALSPASPDTVVGRFDNAHFKGASSEAWMRKNRSGYTMRTADRDGQPRDFSVKWLLGGKRMQDALTVFPDGRWQVLPVYFHVTGRGEWVDYNAAKQGVVGRDHPFFWSNFRRTANHECLDCHSTALSVGYDRTTKMWNTTFADAGVGCEACHGPGGRHADSGDVDDIVTASKLPKSQAVAICARCHGPREPLYPFLDAAHRFTVGDRYEDFYQPSGLVDGPNRSGEFFVDGRPSSSSFEWQALLQSRCYRQGGATCLTCHTTPHDAQGEHALKPPTCGTCHPVPSSGHGNHTAASCTDCHMPKTVTGVLDHFADHSLDIPVPENTQLHAIPNACATCHPTQTSGALAASIAKWWPNSSRRLRRMRLADAFDETTARKSGPALVGVLRDQSESALLRGFAAEFIGQRYPKDASRLLVPHLNDADALLRTKLVFGLSAANARSAADALAPLLGDASLFVRQAAAETLGIWGDARGVAALEALTVEHGALARPHFALAQVYARTGRLREAREQMSIGLNAMPYVANALVFDAELALRDGDTTRARTSLEEALRFDPQNRSATERLRSPPLGREATKP